MTKNGKNLQRAKNRGINGKKSEKMGKKNNDKSTKKTDRKYD